MEAMKSFMAFWKYDLYPYVLSGECDEIVQDGFVRPKGYGGSRFKPLFILPLEQGAELRDLLNALINGYYGEKRVLHSKYHDKLKKLLSDFGQTC
jgi:hypothetical protein